MPARRLLKIDRDRIALVRLAARLGRGGENARRIATRITTELDAIARDAQAFGDKYGDGRRMEVNGRLLRFSPAGAAYLVESWHLLHLWNDVRRELAADPELADLLPLTADTSDAPPRTPPRPQAVDDAERTDS